MKKTKLIALMIGVVVTGLSFSSAHAEFVLGLQGGFSSSQGEVTRLRSQSNYPSTEILPDSKRGNALGLFGQYRHTLSNNVILGVHLGYTTGSAEWGESGSFVYEDAEDIDNDGNKTELVTDIFTKKYNIDYSYDVLGLVGYRGQKVTPFVMFGLSNMKVKGSWFGKFGTDGGASYNSKDGATLTGVKLAVGVEFPFSDKLVGHVLLHRVDYGKVGLTSASIAGRGRTFAVKQTGIRFGIGYRF